MSRAKRILQIIAYDVQKDRTRLKISDILEKYGKRVNYSVFECMFTPTQLKRVKDKLSGLIDSRTDSVLFYQICVECYTKSIRIPENKKKISIIDFV